MPHPFQPTRDPITAEVMHGEIQSVTAQPMATLARDVEVAHNKGYHAYCAILGDLRLAIETARNEAHMKVEDA